ncbi:MAG: type II toxin-antitoxin system VapC family toxin [Spirochaetaceae bacterium]|nr:type II toxin-antitoxin system VapC family toxin [Spirochaetaceae bacterium]
MTHYLLDACALLAIFNDESEKDTVLDLLEQTRSGAIRLSMSIVQLLEVYYDRLRCSGEEGARIRVDSILAEPITIIESISRDVMYEAGRFKTAYSMSLADSVAAATAKSLTAAVVTKDDEFTEAEQAGEFSVLWL